MENEFNFSDYPEVPILEKPDDLDLSIKNKSLSEKDMFLNSRRNTYYNYLTAVYTQRLLEIEKDVSEIKSDIEEINNNVLFIKNYIENLKHKDDDTGKSKKTTWTDEIIKWKKNNPVELLKIDLKNLVSLEIFNQGKSDELYYLNKEVGNINHHEDEWIQIKSGESDRLPKNESDVKGIITLFRRANGVEVKLRKTVYIK